MYRNPLYVLFVLPLLLAACASIGMPDGGDYDTKPPYVTKCTPANKQTDNKSRKIRINFNEYIKLQNASEKVVVSPPQIEAPDLRAEGKHIRIELFDTLRKNTTYTIDFSDAIVDNNEDNPLGNFTYSFSTGGEIDTFEVSGNVLNAENLEPIKGILVGLHRCPVDSGFTTRPFDRVARTNGSGRFVIRGIAPGQYRVYALQDADGNFFFNQKSEVVAFDTTTIEPYSKPDIRMDTVWRDSTYYDTVMTVPYTHFYPDDIVLKAFLEEGQGHYLIKTERPLPDRFTVYFTAPCDTLPHIRGFNFDADKAFVVESTVGKDTITYWIPDTLLAYNDTLHFAITYPETDTLGRLVPRTDTLELVPKITQSRIRREEQEKLEEWEKRQKKSRRRKQEDTAQEDNPLAQKFLKFTARPNGTIDPNQNVTFTFEEPLASADTALLHFSQKVDTTWVERPFLFLPVDNELRSYRLYAEWRPEAEYRFMTDSAAFVNIFGTVSKETKNTFKVRSLDEYASFFVHLVLPDSNVYVQLLSKSDKVVYTAKAEGGTAEFYYVRPGEYYMRLFIDRNGDGKWTTGNFKDGIQPEEVCYFPKPMTLRARWEVEQDWDVRGIPVVQQKPLAITKQKPDKKKTGRKNKQRKK